jgi:16S rRNA (guanine966-N2)-methyltransferase
MDPPYGTGLIAMAMARVCNEAWIAPGGIVTVETDGERPPLPSGFSLEAERRFGKAFIFILRRNA